MMRLQIESGGHHRRHCIWARESPGHRCLDHFGRFYFFGPFYELLYFLEVTKGCVTSLYSNCSWEILKSLAFDQKASPLAST